MQNLRAAVALSIGLAAMQAYGQQSYVGRYDAYVGYAYLDSPMLNLSENGVHAQGGVRVRPWVSLGFDFSAASGKALITPDLLPTSLQQLLGAQFGQLAAAGRLPSGYVLRVPIDSDTRTFTVGPQFAYHGIKRITLFVRPGLGAVRETATPRPGDPIASAVVAQLTPSGKKTDWTYYYGLGGGFEVNVTDHVSIRTSADFVHDHLFDDILKNGRNTVRFSIGPGFQWGRNVIR